MTKRQIIGFWVTVAASLGAQAAGLSGLIATPHASPIPPPELAFSWQRPAADVIEVQIADQVYLYDAKTHFSINHATVAVERPEGTLLDDPLFGLTPVHRGQATFILSETAGAVLIEYQGCADVGFCYPPMQVELSFSR